MLTKLNTVPKELRVHLTNSARNSFSALDWTGTHFVNKKVLKNVPFVFILTSVKIWKQ